MEYVYEVRMPYFDDDHEHGYYDLGLWSLLDGARAAAEKLAEYISPGAWAWEDREGQLPHIVCRDPWGNEYITVSKTAIDEPLPEDLKQCLHITYT